MRIAVVVVVACGSAEPPIEQPPPPVVRQIKSTHELRAPAEVAPYRVGDHGIEIDGRWLPVTGEGPLAPIAHAFARVPPELRPLAHALIFSATASANDDYFAKKYKMPVKAGMSTAVSGDITIYPYGMAELQDEDFFVKNLMHELGHAWSLVAWQDDPASATAWRTAIASDADPPSEYARMSFRSSGAMDEDAAEATALFFVERGTPDFERYRRRMPARFALLTARFTSWAR